MSANMNISTESFAVEEYDEDTKEELVEEYEDTKELKKRKEKILSLLRLNTEESLRGIQIYGNIISRAFVEPVYRDGIRVGTSFSVENIRIDEEIEEQLKKIGL